MSYEIVIGIEQGIRHQHNVKQSLGAATLTAYQASDQMQFTAHDTPTWRDDPRTKEFVRGCSIALGHTAACSEHCSSAAGYQRLSQARFGVLQGSRDRDGRIAFEESYKQTVELEGLENDAFRIAAYIEKLRSHGHAGRVFREDVGLASTQLTSLAQSAENFVYTTNLIIDSATDYLDKHFR